MRDPSRRTNAHQMQEAEKCRAPLRTQHQPVLAKRPGVYLSRRSPLRGYGYMKGSLVKWSRAYQVTDGMRRNFYVHHGLSGLRHAENAFIAMHMMHRGLAAQEGLDLCGGVAAEIRGRASTAWSPWHRMHSESIAGPRRALAFGGSEIPRAPKRIGTPQIAPADAPGKGARGFGPLPENIRTSIRADAPEAGGGLHAARTHTGAACTGRPLAHAAATGIQVDIPKNETHRAPQADVAGRQRVLRRQCARGGGHAQVPQAPVHETPRPARARRAGMETAAAPQTTAAPTCPRPEKTLARGHACPARRRAPGLKEPREHPPAARMQALAGNDAGAATAVPARMHSARAAIQAQHVKMPAMPHPKGILAPPRPNRAGKAAAHVPAMAAHGPKPQPEMIMRSGDSGTPAAKIMRHMPANEGRTGLEPRVLRRRQRMLVTASAADALPPQ